MGEKYAADGAEVRIHALQVEIVAWLVVFFAGNKRKGIFYTETKIMIYLVLFFFFYLIQWLRKFSRIYGCQLHEIRFYDIFVHFLIVIQMKWFIPFKYITFIYLGPCEKSKKKN